MIFHTVFLDRFELELCSQCLLRSLENLSVDGLLYCLVNDQFYGTMTNVC